MGMCMMCFSVLDQPVWSLSVCQIGCNVEVGVSIEMCNAGVMEFGIRIDFSSWVNYW